MKQPFLPLENILGAATSRDDAYAAIRADASSHKLFSSFPPDEQERLLSFIQGAQGLKITYDSFFKYVMNPDTHPSRLSRFLSAILGQNVTIRAVLPTKGTHMAEAGSFVIMDIVVELSNHTLVNVEIQKVGYLFPGERASCYLSDFVMRQYNRAKAQHKKHFSFRSLKPVILIVIMEESSPEFKAVFPNYIHREITSYDSGAQVKSLFQTIYISLDTFHSVVQNISTKLEAWLMFLSSDRPADIVRLVSAYPEFLPCYRDIIEFRRNPKELIFMYSEALAILDHNTIVYMVDQQRKEIEDLKEKMSALAAEKDSALAEKECAFLEKEQALAEKECAFLEKEQALAEKEIAFEQIESLQKQIAALRNKR